MNISTIIAVVDFLVFLSPLLFVLLIVRFLLPGLSSWERLSDVWSLVVQVFFSFFFPHLIVSPDVHGDWDNSTYTRNWHTTNRSSRRLSPLEVWSKIMLNQNKEWQEYIYIYMYHQVVLTAQISLSVFLSVCLSLSIYHYHPSLPACLPNHILCPYKADVNKFLLVG